MPGQEEHDKPENLVEASEQLEGEAARTLGQAADSHATLDGYYAINNRRPPESESGEGDEPQHKK